MFLLLFASSSATACRCAEQTLAEYFAGADEVFIGTLLHVQTMKGAAATAQLQLHFDRHTPAYKANSVPTRQLPYVSHQSTAACAVPVEIGAVYVVFAQHDDLSDTAWINSCNGTRIHRSIQGEMFGFKDVPERFVASQLTALSGLDALRNIARVEADATNLDNTAVIGLLDVAAFSHTSEIPVFTKPVQTETEAVRISRYEDLQHREAGYEVDAALVYALVDGWYKIQLSNGEFGWLAADAAGTFWPLEDLLPGRLTYLTQDWNRFVWPVIGAGIPLRLSFDGEHPPREQAVNIISSQRIGQSLWFEVEVLQNNACEGGSEQILARGWVPAYAESGEPVAWFYSRGC